MNLIIGRCKKAIQMVREMVIDWLRTGMFNEEDSSVALQKSTHIADTLIDAEIFKSHDRHIRPEDCLNIGLKVCFLEDKPDLQDAVLSVHHTCMHTLTGTQAFKIIENHTGKAFIQLQAHIPN